MIGPFLPLQGTSSHETVIDTDSTDENIISSTGAVGAIERNDNSCKKLKILFYQLRV